MKRALCVCLILLVCLAAVPFTAADDYPVCLDGYPVYEGSDLCLGDIVTFGRYEQDGISYNGKEEIEWIVIDQDGDSVLLLSLYGLDVAPYNSETVNTNWANCSLRAWLNGTFYKTAFNGDERAIIETTYVDNSSSQGLSDSLGGPATHDNVFLLSYREAYEYMPSSYDRMCLPTDYAMIRCCMISAKYRKEGMSTTYWWTRSSGRTRIMALLIHSDGNQGYENVSWGNHASDNMYHSGACVRPAVWVTIE